MKSHRRDVLRGVLGVAGMVVSGTSTTSSLSARTLQTKSVQVEERGWPGLVANWKLDGDFRDSTAAHHGEGHGIKFVEGRDGRAGGAAVFNGIDSFVEVPHEEALPFGTREFSLTFWVNLQADITSIVGDVLTKYDPALRRGINLSINTSSTAYSSVGDAKNLQFGIDSGISGSWMDCGRPWKSNPLVSALTVYKGQLYAGIASASRSEDACHVFRYAEGTDWIDCGRLGRHPLTLSAMSMIVHQGYLYAGTGVWDWERAIAGIGGPNHVYRYEGGTEWRDCGQLGNGYRTFSLASFKGTLYAGDDTGRCYCYDGDKTWTFCGQLGKDDRLLSMTVYRGHLYASSSPAIYRYEGGTTWVSIGRNPLGTTQVHKLQVYDGELFAGTWPYGKVLRYAGGDQWVDCGQLGIATDKFRINEINDLTVYNGKLYAGVIPKAEVYRYEGGTDWTLLRRLVSDPRWSPSITSTWCRVPCMAVFQGRLFQGTSTCEGRYDPNNPAEAGRVYAMEAGKSVCFDDDLGTGWKHVAAIREHGRLKLYVNGQLKATSGAFDNSDYDVATRFPLFIGRGAQNYFSGLLDDIRIYGGALTSAQVSELYRQ